MKARGLLLILVILTAFYWKLTLTRQFTFLESVDQADTILPWLQLEVTSLRSGVIPLWTPYEWFGQSLIGQVQPGVAGVFTWLIALAPLRDGHIQVFWVHLWFVFIHIAGAWFAWLLLVDLRLSQRAALIGALLFGTMGFYGTTDWPLMLAAAIWIPLVFLFLLRAVRGRAPLASSCLAGLFTGMSWLSGHHSPALYLTLAAVASYGFLLRKVRFFGAYILILGLVSSLQVLPAVEYGRLAVRWTNTGTHEWNQPVIFPEHAASGLPPSGIIHLFLQNADRQFDSFTGVIAFSLALLGVAAVRRLEVHLFTGLALGSLLFAMPSNFFPYGALYVLVPLVEKARSPTMAFCIFHFAVACLAAFGAEQLLSGESRVAAMRIAKAAAIFGGVLFALYFLADFFRPTVTSVYLTTDTRPAMFALLALLFAALCLAIFHAAVKPATAAVLLCLLVLTEQGNVAGFYWVHSSETARATFLAPLTATSDIAQFLRPRQPARTEVNRKDGLAFDMGDWYSLQIGEANVPSMLASTLKLGWWSDRMARMYGIRYTISKAPTRPGQKDVFTSRTGYKVFENPGVLPRVWTVHEVVPLSTDDFDYGSKAVVAGTAPALEQCGQPDQVVSSDFRLQTVRADVQMGCRGLLVVSDNWYPGWHADVDGRDAPILKIDTVIRGVVVERGRHTLTMSYRPGSVILGFILFLLGVGLTLGAILRPDWFSFSSGWSSSPRQL